MVLFLETLRHFKVIQLAAEPRLEHTTQSFLQL